MTIKEYLLLQTMGSIRRYHPNLTDAELRAKAEKVMKDKQQGNQPLNFIPLSNKYKNVKLYIY
jgi:hypothetical protein